MTLKKSVKIYIVGAGEMAQWLNALSADQGSLPSTHMAVTTVYNVNIKAFDTFTLNAIKIINK